MVRIRISEALGIFFVLLASLLRRCVSDVNRNPGTALISEECAPSGRRKKIFVDYMSILCDSNQYDQQGPTYQSSPNCRAGDRAKVEIDFRILHAQSKNISIDVAYEAGFYQNMKMIRNVTDLCDFKSLNYLGHTTDDDDAVRTQACPLRRGPYQLYTSFTVPDFTENDPEGIAFTPAMKLHFYEDTSGVEVGCVETGTLAMLSEGKRNQRRGERFLMFCVLGLALAAAVCFVGHWKRRKAGEVASNRRAKLRRFHYRRDNEILMTTINPSASSASSGGPIISSAGNILTSSAEPLREVT